MRTAAAVQVSYDGDRVGDGSLGRHVDHARGRCNPSRPTPRRSRTSRSTPSRTRIARWPSTVRWPGQARHGHLGLSRRSCSSRTSRPVRVEVRDSRRGDGRRVGSHGGCWRDGPVHGRAGGSPLAVSTPATNGALRDLGQVTPRATTVWDLETGRTDGSGGCPTRPPSCGPTTPTTGQDHLVWARSARDTTTRASLAVDASYAYVGLGSDEPRRHAGLAVEPGAKTGDRTARGRSPRAPSPSSSCSAAT